MKNKKYFMRIMFFILIFVTSIFLNSCSEKMDIGNNTELGTQFMDYVINDEYDNAYNLIKNTVDIADFNNYWPVLREIAEGADTYEMEQIGWNVKTSNGVATRTTAYQVYFDNGKIALFHVNTCDDIGGIAGIYFSDITNFESDTNSFVSVGNIVLVVVSLLSFAFCIWMFVDCLRRKPKRKVLWLILIFFGLAFTVTVGEKIGIRFMIGLMLQTSNIAADPGIKAVILRLVVPLGAIIYFCVRKRLTVAPLVVNEASQITEISVTGEETQSQ